MQEKTMKVQTGVIPIGPIISGILAIAGAGGWFTQADWAPELLGDLTNDHSTGKIINALESETGQTFPQLRTMLQKVVDSWRTFQRASPFDKARTAEEYEAKVREFANAVKQQAESYQEETTLLPTLGKIPTALAQAVVSPEWWKKAAPWIGVGTLAVILLIVALRKK